MSTRFSRHRLPETLSMKAPRLAIMLLGPESASSFRFKNLTGPHPVVNQKLMYFHNLSPLHSRFRGDALNVPGKQLGLDING